MKWTPLARALTYAGLKALLPSRPKSQLACKRAHIRWLFDPLLELPDILEYPQNIFENAMFF
jgi:hypothetical protein